MLNHKASFSKSKDWLMITLHCKTSRRRGECFVDYLGIFLVCGNFSFKDFIYLFLERGKGWEKENKRNINVCLPVIGPALGTWPATQACALTGNQTSDPLVRRPVLNPLSHTSQRKIFKLLVFKISTLKSF